MQRGITLLVLLFMITFTKGQRRITFDKAVLSQKVQQLSGSKDSAVVRRYLIRTTDLSRMNQLLSSNGLLSAVKQTFIPGKVIMLELPFTRINELFGKTDLIEFIDARPAPVEETHINGFDRTANGLNLMRVKYPRYNGEGLVVSIKERRFDTSDIDLKNRIIFSGLEAETMTTHASQMATMIAGGGNSSDFSLGAAWGAGVSSSSFETLLPDAIESYVNSKISVQNHSYGTAVENYYGADAAAYDASVRELPYLLHVFSAGNSGDMTPGTGTYTGIAGVANITGSFKMAKNILTIGATDSLSKLESRSSRGPAYDGRIKPELVAYGHDGSSGAAAIVSGIALTLQQAYKEKEGKLPDASLVKAVIMNTADDVGKPGPDFESGYGAANGLHALQAVDSGWYASGRTTAGEDKNHLIRIPAGVAKLKVMLTWSDPEAEANAVKALVNNLDVEVSNSSSMVFKPWILHTGKNDLGLDAVVGLDTLNNVEQVTINDPDPGIYTITVTNTLAAAAQQDYSISYYFEKQDVFEWNYPAAFDQLHANDRNLLRWKTDLKGKGLLSVSVDSGFTWKSIKDIADLESNATEWYPEPGFYSAKLKIQTTGKEFVSPTFRVSSPIKPHVILNCSDSAVVNWKRIPGISKYEIFKLPGKYLEPAVSTSDSFFVLNNDFGEFIAVAPVIDDSTGQRGFTQNVNSQSAGCYSNNLLADLQDYGDVIIRFEAGTVYRVAAISLERSSGNSYIEIEKVVNPSQVHFEWIDKQAKQGLSFYRVKITLNNSQEIYSEVVQVTNAGKHDFLFFPVPVKAGQPLSILSASPDDAVLFIYDVFGRTLLQKNLYERIETIRIHQPGTYFYQVQMAGKRVKTGKLVVN